MQNDDNPMMWELKVTGCYFQDRNHLKKLSHVDDMYNAIQEVRELIYKRLKWDSKESEEEFLRNILTELHVEGLEW